MVFWSQSYKQMLFQLTVNDPFLYMTQHLGPSRKLRRLQLTHKLRAEALADNLCQLYFSNDKPNISLNSIFVEGIIKRNQ